MKITFTELEDSESALFEEALAPPELAFVDSLSDVDPQTEVLCCLIDSRVGGAFLRDHPNLRFIATRSTTTDHIDLASCAEMQITVCDVPSYWDHVVAEHAFALLLALTHSRLHGPETRFHGQHGRKDRSTRTLPRADCPPPRTRLCVSKTKV